ncbi:MAG: hypothetical protein EOP55_18065 [Sphingobacteriales bacterium]|nr:MAG: hypothetical protein EOP55_18065 [Sphingobacteriales bacterium]
MDLNTTQWIIAILVFLLTALILAKSTYKKYRNESGPRFWNTRGGKTNYYRLVVVVSLFITVMVMGVVKTITG